MTVSHMKMAAAFAGKQAAEAFANERGGDLLLATSDATRHLPFAALYLGATDDVAHMQDAADVGVYLVCERAIKNQPLSTLNEEELPGSIGIFTMVANPSMGSGASDRHWRDDHAPLALKVHSAMTHYYQLSVVHRFVGPDWHGFALCCFSTEDDLRHRFFNSKEGERAIAEDVARFADTRQSPRRVVASIKRISTRAGDTERTLA